MREVVEVARALPDRRVVVALDDDRPSRRALRDELDHRPRLRAVADEIAEKRHPLRAALLRVLQAGAHRLEVGVEVGEERDNHPAQYVTEVHSAVAA